MKDALEKISLSPDIFKSLLEIFTVASHAMQEKESYSVKDASFSLLPEVSFISVQPDKSHASEYSRASALTLRDVYKNFNINGNIFSKCKLYESITALQLANFNFHWHTVFSDRNDLSTRQDVLLCLPLVSGCYQIANPKDKSIASTQKPSGYYTFDNKKIEDYSIANQFIYELPGDELGAENIFSLHVNYGDAVLLDTSIYHKFRSDHPNPNMAIFCPEIRGFSNIKEYLESL